MTRLVAEKGFNMNSLNNASLGDPSPKGINALAFDYGPGLLRLWGNYDFDRDVGATSGNFRALTYISNGSITVRLNSFAEDAVDFQEFATVNSGRAMFQRLLTGADTLVGSDQRDVLYGFAGDDQLFGNKGRDALFGGAGDDRLFGGDGNNYLSGGSGNDKLVGGKDNDRLFGGSGQDSLIGGFGDDRLSGGAGNDYLTGGAGNDTFVFNTGGGRDIVYDLSAGDTLLISNALRGTYANAAALVEGAAIVGENGITLDLGSTKIRLAGITSTDGLADFIDFF
jgi:Ca2+-binding RTX toxin-like protein